MHLYEPTTFLKVTFTSGVFLDMFQIFRTPNLTVHLTKSFKINNLVYFLIVLDLCFYPALVALSWNMWYICKMIVSQKKKSVFCNKFNNFNKHKNFYVTWLRVHGHIISSIHFPFAVLWQKYFFVGEQVAHYIHSYSVSLNWLPI